MSLFTNTRAGLAACLITFFIWTPYAFGQADTSRDEGILQLAAVVNRVLDSNPEILAAQAAAEAANQGLKGASLPLNNPELEMEAERSDIDTFTVSFSQTIDWHDKQKGMEQVAQAEYASALAAVESLRLMQASELLDIIGQAATHYRITSLSQQRTVILGRFLELAEQRYAAGDITQSEQELARLSLAEAIMQHASNGAELIQARSDFFRLSGEALNLDLRFPEKLPTTLSDSEDDDSLVNNHPEFKAAYLAAQISRKQILAIDLERKVDPGFSVTAGREDDESLIGIAFTIPLQLRNNFDNSVDVARAQSLQSEQQAQQVYRILQARIKSARERYLLVSNAWALWLSRGSVSLQQNIDLLEAQWQSGEMNTGDYLQQVQQTLDTRITSVELHGSVWSAWVEWLSASGTLNHRFNLLQE